MVRGSFSCIAAEDEREPLNLYVLCANDLILDARFGYCVFQFSLNHVLVFFFFFHPFSFLVLLISFI